jgi:DNA-directed RNA polymerase specialized sigma subunit
MDNDIMSAIDVISYNNYIATSRSNEKQIERMQDVVTELIPTALTERQAQCIQMYFFDGLTMPQIAEILHITCSTVSRNIKGAVNKLYKKAANILDDGTEQSPQVKKKDLLTDKQRACYDLHLEGYRHKDIADKLGIAASTVSRHIKAAEKKIRLVANTTSMDSQAEDFSEIEAMLAQI